MATVFIVGGRGFVGSHVVRRFVKTGYRVHVYGPEMPELAKDRLAGLGDKLVTVTGSIEDSADLLAALQASQAELVISCAAYGEGRQGLLKAGESNGERALAVNVLGFRRLLQAAVRVGVKKVLWASSTVVYGPASDYDGARVDESSLCRPRSVYGLSKVLAEQIARYFRDTDRLPVTGLRLPLVFGPGLWYQGAAAALLGLINNARSGRVYHVTAPADPFDLMYVKDVAEAFLQAARFTGPLQEVYNINGFTTSYPQIIEMLCELVPNYQANFTGQAAPFSFALLDQQRIERELGFKPRFDLRGALRDYLKTPVNER